MKSKSIALGLLLALVISIVPLVFANGNGNGNGNGCVCEYTPGYWKHNVRVYVERQGSYAADISGVKESDASMEGYEAWIRANMDSEFTLEWANVQFWMRGPGRQPIRQMIADWFNAAKAA